MRKVNMYIPRKEEEYIALCKYFDGTEKSCEGEDGTFAFYEQCWVQLHYLKVEDLRYMLEKYKSHGLEHFSEDDGVPITLKALLWSRYCHWHGCSPEDDEEFKEYYIKRYLKRQQ